DRSLSTQTATPEISTLSLHDALPIYRGARQLRGHRERPLPRRRVREGAVRLGLRSGAPARSLAAARREDRGDQQGPDARHHHGRSEEHTSELQSREKLVCRLLLEKKK